MKLPAHHHPSTQLIFTSHHSRNCIFVFIYKISQTDVWMLRSIFDNEMNLIQGPCRLTLLIWGEAALQIHLLTWCDTVWPEERHASSGSHVPCAVRAFAMPPTQPLGRWSVSRYCCHVLLGHSLLLVTKTWHLAHTFLWLTGSPPAVRAVVISHVILLRSSLLVFFTFSVVTIFLCPAI